MENEKKLKVNRDVFVLPYESEVILYAPLAGAILRTSPGVVNFLKEVNAGKDPNEMDKDLTSKLVQYRILRENKGVLTCTSQNGAYLPTSVTLLPTYDCNLKCVYCYSCAGDNVTQVMTPEIAKASIDFIISNAVSTNNKRVSLSFHGGGEPFLTPNMPLVKYSIGYFREECEKNKLNGEVTAVTNGTFRENTLEYLLKNLDRVSISMDGPKDIQEKQRPTRGEFESSYDLVIRNIQRLEDSNIPYNIRATITAESVERMPEIYNFFMSLSKRANFHLEPLFECGRCEESQKKSPDANIFADMFLKTRKLARENKRDLTNSSANVGRVSETYCGACGYNFFVTPLGDITTCLESCRRTQESSAHFFIGKYNPEKKSFDIDQNKIDKLKDRRVSNMSHCENCFAKYNCSGDCLSKILSTGENMLDPSNNKRCESTLKILYEDIVEIANGEQ